MADKLSIAKKAVVEYWNGNKTLVKKFGDISSKKIFVVWQVKAVQNFKALLAVYGNDDLYFEYTYNGDAKEAYLDIYKKQAHKVIEL